MVGRVVMIFGFFGRVMMVLYQVIIIVTIVVVGRVTESLRLLLLPLGSGHFRRVLLSPLGSPVLEPDLEKKINGLIRQ